MGDIGTALAVIDNMTDVIETNLDYTVETNLDFSFNIINQQLALVQNNILIVGQCQDNVNDKVKKTESFMDKLQKKAIGFVGDLMKTENIKMVLGLSDEFTVASSHLAKMNDGMQTQKVLQDMVYASAQRSRTGYMETMETVTQLGTRAKEAFSSNAEAIQFSENMNKMFAIGGTGDIGAATEQIIQGLESGTFSAEAMNGIFQATPGMLQMMADSLGMPAENLQALADQGGLTADIMRDALLGATDSINQGFGDVPITFSDIATQVQNAGLSMFEPILEKLNEVANSEQFQGMIDGIINGLSFLASVAGLAFDLMCEIGYLIADNWSVVEPVLYGIIVALGIAALSQMVMNAALMASPITWIVLGIMALVAILYLGIEAFNYLTGSSVSATEVICGALAVAGAFIGNIFITLYNSVITIGVGMYNYFAMFANFFANLFNDPAGTIIRVLAGLFNYIADIVQGAAGLIDKFLGTDLSGKVASFRDLINKSVDDKLDEQKVVLEPLVADDYLKDKIDYKGAYDTGKKFGAGLTDKVNGFDPKKLLPGGGLGDTSGIPEASDLGGIQGNPVPNAVTNPATNLGTTPAANTGLENITNNTGATANNTEEIKNSVDISKVDLKYLRDIAEQKIINRFTTAEIKVDMKNYNSVNNDQDLDGMSETLRKKLVEQMNMAAEGVHA